MGGAGAIQPSSKAQQSEELKKEKKGWLQALFGGKSKKDKEKEDERKEQLKAEKAKRDRLKNSQHSTYDPMLMKKFDQQQREAE